MNRPADPMPVFGRPARRTTAAAVLVANSLLIVCTDLHLFDGGGLKYSVEKSELEAQREQEPQPSRMEVSL